jgi:hypothetical protein
VDNRSHPEAAFADRSASADEALVGLEPPRPGAIDDRAQPAHLPFVAVTLGGAKAPHRVEELLVQGNLLGPDLGAV